MCEKSRVLYRYGILAANHTTLTRRELWRQSCSGVGAVGGQAVYLAGKR